MKKLYLLLTLALALGLLVGLTTGTAVLAAQPGKKIQIPSINVENGWSTWIHAQNVGDDDTGAVVFFWEEYSELCPPNSPGPAAAACRIIVNNGVWTLRSDIPTKAKAAIIYSVDEDVFDEACQEAADAVGDDSAWLQWEDEYQGTGQLLAAVVLRFGPNTGSRRGAHQRHTNPHQHCNTNIVRNFDQHAAPYFNPDLHTDSYANRDTHSNADSNWHDHPNGHNHIYSNRYAYGDCSCTYISASRRQGLWLEGFNHKDTKALRN